MDKLPIEIQWMIIRECSAEIQLLLLESPSFRTKFAFGFEIVTDHEDEDLHHWKYPEFKRVIINPSITSVNHKIYLLEKTHDLDYVKHRIHEAFKFQKCLCYFGDLCYSEDYDQRLTEVMAYHNVTVIRGRTDLKLRLQGDVDFEKLRFLSIHSLLLSSVTQTTGQLSLKVNTIHLQNCTEHLPDSISQTTWENLRHFKNTFSEEEGKDQVPKEVAHQLLLRDIHFKSLRSCFLTDASLNNIQFGTETHEIQLNLSNSSSNGLKFENVIVPELEHVKIVLKDSFNGLPEFRNLQACKLRTLSINSRGANDFHSTNHILSACCIFSNVEKLCIDNTIFSLLNYSEPFISNIKELEYYLEEISEVELINSTAHEFKSLEKISLYICNEVEELPCFKAPNLHALSIHAYCSTPKIANMIPLYYSQITALELIASGELELAKDSASLSYLERLEIYGSFGSENHLTSKNLNWSLPKLEKLEYHPKRDQSSPVMTIDLPNAPNLKDIHIDCKDVSGRTSYLLVLQSMMELRSLKLSNVSGVVYRGDIEVISQQVKMQYLDNETQYVACCHKRQRQR